MIIYIERQKKIINTDQVYCFEVKDCGKTARVESYLITGRRDLLCSVSHDKADEFIEMIATAMDRGQEMLWIKQEDS